jgi:ABC-2 type transport system permease protein
MTTYAGNEVFETVSETGWRRGLGNLLSGELSNWFKTTRWLKHSIIWLLAINLVLFFTTLSIEEDAAQGEVVPDVETLMLYSIFGGMFVMFGVLIMLQTAVVGEKKSGTAAWVLSKPVSRSAFVISKLIGYSIGILLTAVLIPGIVAYVEIGALTPLGFLPPLQFIAGVAALGIHAMFWLTFTLMMGTFFDSFGVVIGIPIALAFGQQYIIGLLPFLTNIVPWGLSAPMGSPEAGELPSIAVSLMNGDTPYSYTPIIAAVVFSVIFTAVALVRFNRQEF